MKIFRQKSAKSISTLTFLGFLLIQLAVVLHGFITQDYILVGGYLLSMLTCGTVVVLIFVYKKRDFSLSNVISLEQIIKQVPGHIYWKNKAGICLGCNTENWKYFGLNSLNEFIGKSDFDLIPAEEASKLREVDERVIRMGETLIVEEQTTISEGVQTLYLSHKAPLRNDSNEIIGIVGVSLDITEAKKETEEQLEMLENIIAVMPGHVYWMDKKGIYLGCNNNQAKAIGFSSRKEIVGKSNNEIPGSYVVSEVLDKFNKEVLEIGKTISVEEPAILTDGTEAIFFSNKVPIRNRKNEIIGIVGISIDISEHKKTEQELRIAKEAAEAANRAKMEFLYNMKHDLRTPFSGILGMAEFMKDNEQDPEKKDNLACIAQSAEILLKHINEIFDFITLESGTLPVVEKQFDLYKLLQDTFSMMRPAAEDKKLIFTLDKEQKLPQYVIGDRVRTQRVLMNLLSNALKFTKKGHITLRTAVAKSEKNRVILKFVVEDSGIGIPEDKRDLIFEPFNRLTAAYSGVYAGKGLGLRMVKHFLDEIGGEAHVESELNKGSVFKILIPYRPTLLNCAEESL